MAHMREAITFVSAGSYTTGFKIEGNAKVAIEFPAIGTLFATKSPTFYPQVARRASDTFYDLYDQLASGYSGVMGSATSGDFIVNIPAEGNNYLKLSCNTVATDGYTAYIHYYTFK